MQLGDVEAVFAIDKRSFNLPWTERSYRYELTENQNSSAWVAEVSHPDGSLGLAGMIVTWLILDEAHVATIAVLPEYRQLGIGRRLLATCLLEMVSRGADKALLEVRRGNLPAQAMYNHFGFEIVGERPHYYRDNGEDALLMTLPVLDVERLQRLAA
jgi:ribosomal-protein-alanine N-acetyltransferase